MVALPPSLVKVPEDYALLHVHQIDLAKMHFQRVGFGLELVEMRRTETKKKQHILRSEIPMLE